MLALRALGLGDALTGVPALRGLRRRWPDARLVLAAPAPVGGWLRDLGVVDAVLPVDGIAALESGALTSARAGHPAVLERTPDVAVNLHGRGPESTAALAALGPGLLVRFAVDGGPRGGARGASAGGGRPADGAGPLWDEEEHEVDRWCRLVRSVGGGCGPTDLVLTDLVLLERRLPDPAPVVLHPGAASASRRWPVERWADVAAALLGRGHDVVLTGSSAEQGVCAHVAAAARARGRGAGAGHPALRDLSGRLDLAELAAAVAGAALLVCGDTGVAHLATATRTPSVLLFGPTSPQRWGPATDRDRHTVLWPAPAGYRGDPHGASTDPVLASTTVGDVLTAAHRSLGRPRASRPATSRP